MLTKAQETAHDTLVMIPAQSRGDLIIKQPAMLCKLVLLLPQCKVINVKK